VRSLPAAPAWGGQTLADVLPAVAASMNLGLRAAGARGIGLPAVDRVCLLLVDGLGLDQLTEADVSDAPFLRSLAIAAALDAGFPSSTPVSLCSLGTGRPPGEHGIVGFTLHVPPVPAVVECLGWTRYGTRDSLIEALPPERLQPHGPWPGLAGVAGVAVTVVSHAAHVGTGLTRAAFRGARFDPIDAFEDLDDRASRVRDGLRLADRALVYTYDPRLDTAAHLSGVGSPPWREALRAVDGVAERLAAALPRGAALLVTGDHGGLDVPPHARVDLADRPDLAAGVAWLSGEPRMRHVHAVPGRDLEVLAAWREGLGGWTVLARNEAIAAGLFGPRVVDDVRPRIGDVVAIAGGSHALFDRNRFPWERRLVALHGGLSRAELKVPLLVATA
jgi:hypothetical protein